VIIILVSSIYFNSPVWRYSSNCVPKVENFWCPVLCIYV